MTLAAKKSNNSIQQRLRHYLLPLIFMTADYVAVMLIGQVST